MTARTPEQVASAAAYLDGLEAAHMRLLDGVADGEYALWLGSGISLGRAASVKDFLVNVLTFLWGHACDEHHAGPHASALRQIVSMGGLSGGSEYDADPSLRPSSWPRLQDLLTELHGKYSAVLDVEVEGFPPDYLVWDGVDIVAGYAGVTEPDSEHLLLAAIAAEACAPVLVSANWDGLIERALEELIGSDAAVLKVAIDGASYRGPVAQTMLAKFHGCAVKAHEDEARFRDALIARESQITGWFVQDRYRQVRERLIGIALDRPTLMAGLSAQDVDIQQIFGMAANTQPWIWPSDRGAMLIAAPQIGHAQAQLLKSTYGATAYNARSQEIRDHAVLGEYARPVFAALLATTWVRKFLAYANTLDFPGEVEEALRLGLRKWGSVAMADLRDSSADQVRSHLAEWSVSLRGFRGIGPDPLHTPLGVIPRHRIGLDQDAARRTGNPYLAAVIGLVFYGEIVGRWRVTSADFSPIANHQIEGTNGQVRTVAMFRDDLSLAAAHTRGQWDESDSTAVTVMATSVRPSQRTPTSARGRSGRRENTILTVTELFHGADNLDEVLGRMAMEALV